jgi:nitrite reductase/ring-hydroxylating ferredoxin subunit
VIFLCRAEELARTGARSVVLGESPDTLDVLVIEHDGARRAYLNACPHQFIPLETFPDWVFSEDRKHLFCSGHGALFVPETGLCVEGPCEGDALTPLAIVEREGAIYLDEARDPREIARAQKAKRNW